MNSRLLSGLQTVGLGEKEARVYLALLQMKKGTALSVAAAAGLKRPTVYLVLEALIGKRLISVTRFRGVRDYRAHSPEHLQHYLRAGQRLGGHILPEMKKMYYSRPIKLRLRTWEGILALKTLLEKMLSERAAIYVLGDEKNFAGVLGDYWDYFLKRCSQLGITPRFNQFSGEVALFLWSDKVAFANLGQPVQSFGFKNKELHTMYKKIYQSYAAAAKPGRAK